MKIWRSRESPTRFLRASQTIENTTLLNGQILGHAASDLQAP